MAIPILTCQVQGGRPRNDRPLSLGKAWGQKKEKAFEGSLDWPLLESPVKKMTGASPKKGKPARGKIRTGRIHREELREGVP